MVNIDGFGEVPLKEGFEQHSTVGIWDIINSLKESFTQGGTSNLNEVHTEFFAKLKIGDPGTLIVFAFSVVLGLVIAYQIISRLFPEEAPIPVREVEERDPPRDFTLEQLREFDGTQENKKIYIGLVGEVFDVTKAAEFYGPGACYHCFAGREASRAMARLSFEESDLSNNKIDDLGPFEKSTLNEWVDKFKNYKNYPIVGRVSVPTQFGDMTSEVLLKYKGDTSVTPTSPNRISPPLLLALKGIILDVGYGGAEMYAPGGPYNRLLGIDASRALAKMSFEPEDINSRDLSDLTPQQGKTLNDWEKKFVESKKYPIVGKLID